MASAFNLRERVDEAEQYLKEEAAAADQVRAARLQTEEAATDVAANEIEQLEAEARKEAEAADALRLKVQQEAEVKALCAKAREILVEESNVQRVDAPVTVRARPAGWTRAR